MIVRTRFVSQFQYPPLELAYEFVYVQSCTTSRGEAATVRVVHCSSLSRGGFLWDVYVRNFVRDRKPSAVNRTGSPFYHARNIAYVWKASCSVGYMQGFPNVRNFRTRWKAVCSEQYCFAFPTAYDNRTYIS